MNPKRVVIVGGSGFIGSAIANRLCKEGVKVLIPTRRRSRAGHVLLLPNVEVVEGNVHDVALLARLTEIEAALGGRLAALSTLFDTQGRDVETALAADSMSSTIASIRNDSGMVAGEISTLSEEFSKMGERLQSLEQAATEFSRRVA